MVLGRAADVVGPGVLDSTLGERPEGDGWAWHLPTAPAVSTREEARAFGRAAEPQILDSTAFERAFGMAPTPLEETVDAPVTWYEQWLSRP